MNGSVVVVERMVVETTDMAVPMSASIVEGVVNIVVGGGMVVRVVTGSVVVG